MGTCYYRINDREAVVFSCDPLTQYVRVHVANERQLGQVYFDSFNTAQEAIQIFKEDILQAFRR